MKRLQRTKAHPTIETLHELFRYNRRTGLVHRRKRVGNQAAGAVAGGLTSGGYLTVWVGGVHMQVHRMIWAMVYREWPDFLIDHKNRNKTDNRWRNLRRITAGGNVMNACTPKNNTSGVKGVVRGKPGDRWRAQITVGGKCLSLGQYFTIEEAKRARRAGELRYHGEYAPKG